MGSTASAENLSEVLTGDLTVEVSSDPRRIAALEQLSFVRALPATAQPRFFLASVVLRQWIPRCVIVKCGNEIAGIAYFKERKFGLPTGILYADFSFGGCVAARPDHQEFVLAEALAHLLDNTSARGLRLRLPPDGYEIRLLQRAAQARGAKLVVLEDGYHLILNLFGDYEEFLKSLGYKTRRNLRYYRRRFESGGHSYVQHMEFDEFERVARRLGTRAVVGASDEGIDRALGMLAAAEQPLLAGLRRSDGEWVAIIGGWVEAGMPIIFFQMNNDQDYRTDSLCLVLRAYFFETLATQGYRKLAFWGGTGEPFHQVSTPLPAVSAFLDVQTRSWRIARRILQILAPRLPANFREAIHWITPVDKP